MQITRLDLPRCQVGEGPVWDVAEQALYYIDILAQKVFRWDPEPGDRRQWDLPAMVGSMALRDSGGAIVALPDGVHALDFASGEVTPLALMQPADPAIQLADGKVDRAGRFVFGTSHRQAKEPVGGLYSLGTDGRIARLDSGLTLGNGPCFAPDNRTLYHADSMAHTIYAYDTTSRPAPPRTAGPSSIRAIMARSPTVRQSMPMAICGSRSARAGWCCACLPQPRCSR